MEFIRNIIKFWYHYFSPASRNEELFHKLLFERRFDEAIKLAQQHSYLDIDLVYKLKWRNSGKTVPSIDTYLGSIKDKLWVLNECIKIVPLSYEACRRLIELGLEEANLRLLYQLGDEPEFKKRDNVQQPLLPEDISHDDIEGLIDFENLNEQQKELCLFRQTLLQYEHSISAYENIIGDHRQFDHVFYEEFRQKSPLDACIGFARDGDTLALNILMNYYSDLSTHHLAILSNLPETLSPFQYRNLLPCLPEGDQVYEWHASSGGPSSDWSGQVMSSKEPHNSDFEKQFYDENDHLRKYLKPLTGDVLTQWFLERASEMESRTLLTLNAIQLLRLGSDLNIGNLKTLYEDLVEFEAVIYECCSDEHIYISFSEFSSLPDVDKMLIMTGDSVKYCKNRFRSFVIPYINKRHAELGLDGKSKMLAEYFERLAKQICDTIYDDLNWIDLLNGKITCSS